LGTELPKLEGKLKEYEAALESEPTAMPADNEEKKTERSLLLRRMFDGQTILAIGRELQDSYCMKYSDIGYDKDFKYYDEKTLATAVANITNDGQLLNLAQTYANKLKSYQDFVGKYYTYDAKAKQLKLEGAWSSFAKILDDLFRKHGRATYAVLKAYVEVRKDNDTWSACDYNQLEYLARELAGSGWKKALVALEIGGVIEKRGSGRRPGERSIAPELIPLVENVLSKWEKTQQEPAIRNLGMRSHPPLENEKMSDPIWDVFICHASEDKNEIARPLAEALRRKGLEVWYDEFTLTLGDSLSRSIDHGLARSRFGVVILSPSFFKKEWPRKELDGLTVKEVSFGKTILPIWHNVDREYVLQYSPILSDKLAVSTGKGLEQVVDEILKAVDKARNTSVITYEPSSPNKEVFDKQEPRPIGLVVKQVDLYDKIGKDLLRIRIELSETAHPIDIIFPSWNETVDFEQRDALIGNEELRKAIERLSTALNQRNRRRKQLLQAGWDFQTTQADQDFEKLNATCIDAYEKIRAIKPEGFFRKSEVATVTYQNVPNVHISVFQALNTPKGVYNFQLPKVGFEISTDSSIKARVKMSIYLSDKELGLVDDKHGYYSGEMIWERGIGTFWGNFSIPAGCKDSRDTLRLQAEVVMTDSLNRTSTLVRCFTYDRDNNSWFPEPTSWENLRKRAREKGYKL
jgi:hypothetical protein